MTLIQRYAIPRLYRLRLGATSWIPPFDPKPASYNVRRARAYYRWPPISPASESPTTPCLLSEEQRFTLNLALRGESLFFTGVAGTGKSFLLREIITSLRALGRNVAVTASTGVAALNIDGATLHSFAGVRLGNQHARILKRRLFKKPTRVALWRNTDVLVVDEISMVEARWFDVLGELGKVTRENREPFGGVQVIITGDFFQLPLVPDQAYIDTGVPARFAFQANDWDCAVPNKIKLTQVFRQTQPDLIQMLNDMRMGKVSKSSSKLLYRLSRPVQNVDGINPVELFPLRLLADAANLRQMKRLSGIPVIYRAQDAFGWDIHGKLITPRRGGVLLDRMVADAVELKVGAQVMCIKNIFGRPEIVNGSLGKIIDFVTPEEAKIASYPIDIICDSPPISEHCEYDGPQELKEGCQVDERPQGLGRIPFIPPPIQVSNRKWPVVQFDNGEILLMTPFYFTHENVRGGIEACRAQLGP